MSIEWVTPSNHLILCHPFLLPSIFPSIRVFSNESLLHVRWPKDWSFSFSISPSSEYSGLISFRIDSFDLLKVQETLKSLLQHHSWNQLFSAQTSLWSNSHILKRKENLIPHQKLRPGSGGRAGWLSPSHTPALWLWPLPPAPGRGRDVKERTCHLRAGRAGLPSTPSPVPAPGRLATPPMPWKVLERLSASLLPAEGS